MLIEHFLLERNWPLNERERETVRLTGRLIRSAGNSLRQLILQEGENR
jgi:hypothetical protein